MKKNNNNYLYSTIYLAIGELIVSALIVLGYLLYASFSKYIFHWNVISGALLGSIVTILNFLILSIQVNRALDEYIVLRGDRQMSEEEAEEFAKKNSLKVQNAVTKSYFFRTALMIGSLVLGFITGWFDTVATLIPLLLYKPLIYAVEFINKKRGE